jgi:hypothetical protein
VFLSIVDQSVDVCGFCVDWVAVCRNLLLIIQKLIVARKNVASTPTLLPRSKSHASKVVSGKYLSFYNVKY